MNSPSDIHARLQVLLEAWEDDCIGSEETAELVCILKESAAARRQLANHFLISTGIARELGRDEAKAPSQRLQSRQDNIVVWRRWLAPLAMAASLALVVGGWWLAQSRQPAGLGLRVVEVAGTATIEDGRLKIEDLKSGTQSQESMVYSPKSKVPAKPVVVGMELRQGDRVVVAQGGKIGLKYDSEETTIGLVGTATFENREGGKFVMLEPGRFTCSAAPQPKPFRIQSPHALSTVVGTRFNIEVFDAKTALVVTEGKVQFERDGQTLLVGSNQTAEASDQGLKMLPLAVTAVPSGAPRTLTATVIRKFALGDARLSMMEGIAFDGSVLWECINVPDSDRQWVSKLFKLDPVTGKLLGTVDVSACVQRAYGLDWDGVNLWIGDSPLWNGKQFACKVVAVNPTTGRAVKTLNLPSDFSLAGIAVGDGYLWVGGQQIQGAGKELKVLWRGVRKLDLSSGALVASWPLPQDLNARVKGLAYVNGALWMAGEVYEKDAVPATSMPRPMVLKLNPEDGTVRGSLDTSFVPKGVTSIECLAKSGSAGQMWIAKNFSVWLVEVGEDK